MKAFLNKHFLLESKPARVLYHRYAANQPIFDYHCHLEPKLIAEDRPFENLWQIWLAGDHYKWRALRSFGVDERFITGNAEPYEKFYKYAEMVPYTIGNPLYHWTHLELQRYFGITETLSAASARRIWDAANAQLVGRAWGPRSFLERSKVNVVCTTDDPADSLEYHKHIAADASIETVVLPTFRPDKALAFENRQNHLAYLEVLGQAAGQSIDSLETLVAALRNRHQYFHSIGGRLSDHALQSSVYEELDQAGAAKLFEDYFRGKKTLSQIDIDGLKTYLLREIARLNAERSWTMQLHIGALRNNNSRMLGELGPDTGYDSIADGPIAEKLSAFLNTVEQNGGLPRTIIYNLNPSDNYTIGTMIGNFQDGRVPGKIQFGSGWWFNDQRDGMEDQMRALANLGLLSKFVGMLTDSRSFLSYPRHEYFRRILCNMLGDWVARGEYPWDEKTLGGIVEDICYKNAAGYFGIL